jgi:hypothetical protein
MRGIAIRVGIVAAIIIGGLILKPFLSGNAGDLKVGECFDVPVGAEAIEDVQHHPCSDEHSGEVFFVGKSAAAKDVAYPTDIELAAEVYGLCDSAFVAYTGLDSNTEPVWTYGYFIPTSEGWSDGDRGVICYVAKIDSSVTKGSVKR